MSGFFTRLGILARPFGGRSVPREVSDRIWRWSRANAEQPEMAEDIIIMAKIMAYGDVGETDRLEASALELAYDRGRRDLGLDILAMMHVRNYELNHLLKESSYEQETNEHD